MNYGKVEERSSSRVHSPRTARYAATSGILTVTLSKSDRAPISPTVSALGPESFFTTGSSQPRLRRRTSFGYTFGSQDRSRLDQTSGELRPFRYPFQGCARPIRAPL